MRKLRVTSLLVAEPEVEEVEESENWLQRLRSDSDERNRDKNAVEADDDDGA